MADCTPFCDPCRNCFDANETMRQELSQAKADLAKAQMNEAHEHAASMDYALDAGARNAARVAHYERLAGDWKARAERAEAEVAEAMAASQANWHPRPIPDTIKNVVEGLMVNVSERLDAVDLARVAEERALKSEALAKEQERVIGRMTESLERVRYEAREEKSWPMVDRLCDIGLGTVPAHTCLNEIGYYSPDGKPCNICLSYSKAAKGAE